MVGNIFGITEKPVGDVEEHRLNQLANILDENGEVTYMNRNTIKYYMEILHPFLIKYKPRTVINNDYLIEIINIK